MSKMSKKQAVIQDLSKNKISVFYIFCFLFIASLSSLNANNQNKKMNLEKIVLMGNSITEGWQKD